MGKYDDIINLPHPVSRKHPQMPILDRAAQFAPFAALTGHSAAIKETARLTTEKMELDEDTRIDLDMKLQALIDMIDKKPDIIVTYFKPDLKKSGGSYTTISGKLKKIDEYNQTFVLIDGSRIPLEDIIQMESDLFRGVF